MTDEQVAWEAAGQLLREQGISPDGDEPKSALCGQTVVATWVRTTEICAEMTLEPGVTTADLTEAIKAGLFCWGEVNDPDTGVRIATVGHFDEECVDDDGIVIEEH